MILIELTPDRWVNPDDVSSLRPFRNDKATEIRTRVGRIITVPLPVAEVAAKINRSPAPEA